MDCNSFYINGVHFGSLSLRVCVCVCVNEEQREARCWWLTPVILTTLKAEIGRIRVQSQPVQGVDEILSQQ
jgi:hypothetical protein